MVHKFSFLATSATLCLSLLALPAQASVKVGMAVDHGLGVNLKFNDTVNVFAGNDGFALDYHFTKGSMSNDGSVGYFIGFGGWTDWDDDFGVRMPLGLDWNFTSNWHLTGQLSPAFQIQDKSKFKIDAGFGIHYQF
ncbi:hypothetical protein [Vibrio fortis]|uniref:hypothetical protein n=1 Tax=Vibrio fortis TaxID=212667 RepID=UPI0021C4142C|nr:hypothetical protein [Vibrio fortis]